ncbi:carboxypeptidase Taq [Rhodobacter aestuarii]|uniref:Metal-dependent carboxypeptidase n=1 Tax=Rhodobacter aestuarii TaxID=453582 RepID=A0A1N7M1W6_9RHOB|nr:carboxypeptidase M32 [Rhodobacter aestuarii]PTV94790.1 carboxypeptidase Taq [Rhodobacter aestuarii]SIS80100.1 carboxypeptidase Taq Metallo peptidase. MEROPS family M32 [Rhodobacter aestuarii]
MSAYAELTAHLRETEALSYVAERLGWDQETIMPRAATEQRAEEIAALESVLHARRTDPRIEDWVTRSEATTEVEARVLDLAGRSYNRASRIPARLATELARLTSLSQGIWAEARAAEDPAHFLPTLAQVVALKREEAACLSEGDLYDALMEDYEPGATHRQIGAMFDRMRPRIVALREKVLGVASQPKAMDQVFPEAAQLRMARICATAFGYDWTAGRLDLAVHPFSSGSGRDVRITTRVVESEPFNCLYSTIHEVGHACYEQGIDPAYAFTPLGRGVSMGVHESQSRIYENQLGRSAAFTGWLYQRMVEGFGDFGVADAESFHACVNRVSPGYIRTEADELHYNLHIMMRFDLERALITGKLEVADLEEAWNTRFEADFGVKVDRPSHGFLQDVHWSVGLFGYFPTYSLGNVYAGCLHKTMRSEVDGIDAALAEGTAKPATDWLREKLQVHGGLRPPRETIAHACGFEPSEAPLLEYLEEKFSAIYGL